MPDPAPEPPIAALLRQAGHHLPAATLAELDHAHALLRAMVARIGGTPADAESAITFRPDAPR